MVRQGQTHQLITKIRTLRTKKFYNVWHLVVVNVVVTVVVVGVGDHEGGDVEDTQEEGDQLEGVDEPVTC